MKKKGSLQLSINAIVVLILAITILGLGLNFIKNNFGAVEQQFGQVSQQLEEEMVQKMKESGELLVFNKLQIDVKKGNPEDFYIGVKNTDSGTACFNISFVCLRPQTSGMDCNSAAAANPLPYSVTKGAANTLGWIDLFQKKEIKGGEVFITPVDVLIPTGNADTYLLNVLVRKGPAVAGVCDDGTAATWADYAEQEFFINLA